MALVLSLVQVYVAWAGWLPLTEAAVWLWQASGTPAAGAAAAGAWLVLGLLIPPSRR